MNMNSNMFKNKKSEDIENKTKKEDQSKDNDTLISSLSFVPENEDDVKGLDYITEQKSNNYYCDSESDGGCDSGF